MAETQVQRARGNTSQHATYAGLAGELTVNVDDNSIRVEDGSTLGGHIVGGMEVNAQVGTSYTIAATDQGKLVTFSNGAAVAVTVPQGVLANNFKNGARFAAVNLGAGTVTFTPTTSTVNGAATLVLRTGAWALWFSDGTNYRALVWYPGGQNPGTTTNDNAAAGNVGEYVSSNVAVGSQVSLTSATPANVASISLTAGDWDVDGTVVFNPAGSTTTSDCQAAISTTSATLPTISDTAALAHDGSSLAAGVGRSLPTGTCRVSLSGTTTVYLVAQATFATSTEGAYGFIRARRVR